jgi:site-specific recombinase XerD
MEVMATLIDYLASIKKNPLHQYKLRDTAILAVLLVTGVRADELCTLTIGNVSFARNIQEYSHITVMCKGRKQREIPLGDKSRRVLNRYMREFRKDAKSNAIVPGQKSVLNLIRCTQTLSHSLINCQKKI